MSQLNYYNLLKHVGHKIQVGSYGGDEDAPSSLYIECVDCNEIIYEVDEPFYDKNNKCYKCGCDVVEDDSENIGEYYCINDNCKNSYIIN